MQHILLVRVRKEHRLAVPREAKLLLDAQRCGIARKGAAEHRVVWNRRKDMRDETARRLTHVAATPIGFPDPIADRIAALALHRARGLDDRIDDADEGAIENDRRSDEFRIGRFAHLDEGARIIERVWPWWRR